MHREYLGFVLFILWTSGSAAVAPNCPFYSTNIGDFKVTVLSDGTTVTNDTGAFIPDVPNGAVELVEKMHFLPEIVTVDYNPLYVDTGEHKVIIDTGSSDKFGPTLGKLLENMEKAGLNRQEVDTVVLTHAHVDHIAGIIMPDGQLAFPNAKYYVSREEYDFWQNASLEQDVVQSWGVDEQLKPLLLTIAKGSMDTVRDNLVLFEFGDEILPGLSSWGTIGHSPGHSSYLLRSGDDSLFVAGDVLVVDYVNIEHPEWRVIFDMDPDTGIDTRFSLLEELASSGMKIALYHNSFPGIGNIYRTANGYAFRPARYLF